MPVQRLPRPLPALASALAAAGIVLAVASCSQITPLGPDPAPVTMQAPRHLGSPIIVQVMRVQAPTAAGRCPASWAAVSLPAGGGPRPGIVQAVPVPVKGASAPPAPPPPSAPPPGITCYRPAGAPVTITSAAVSSVFTYRPPSGQANGPDLYGFIVAVPRADVAAVTAVIRRAHDTGSAVGISVAGRLWQAPMVFRPFPGRRLQIQLLSRNQARELHRMLVPSA